MPDSKNLTAVTLGDVMLDYLIDIGPQREPDSQLVNRCYFSPIRTQVAGLGCMFARYAKNNGFDRSVLIGAIGQDSQDQSIADFNGRIAIESLEQESIELELARVPAETGQVAMVFPEERHRFIVANSGANAEFNCDVFDQIDLSHLDGCDVLFVSGYFLVEDKQRQAAVEIITRARQAGALVVVDVVPHEIWQSVPSTEYLDRISLCNSIMITNYTMFDHLGWDRQNAGWDAPKQLVTAQTLDPLLEQMELIVVVLNSKSDYLVVTRQGSLTLFVEHVPYKVSQTRDSMNVHAMILSEYLRHDRKLDHLANKFNVPIAARR